MPLAPPRISTSTPTLDDPNGIDDAVVEIDVKAFVGARALVQANSGGGKSRTLRRILEQTYGHVQHIVVDVEGEFYTLREQHDYLIAGAGGDCAATVKNAARLARLLLETHESAILDISELAEQAAFVKAFCEAMIAAPRELWHPVMTVIDEAQRFCPQDELAVSTQAVIDLMTRGRKRGFGGVLACQRLSELHKSAAAECNNLLIGRTSLDVDIARARKALGMKPAEAEATLPRLKPGEFFCVGPGLTETVHRVRMGHVRTTHPEAGSGAAPMPPAREVTRAMLAKLADLDEQVAAEESELERLRRRVAELEGNGAPKWSVQAWAEEQEETRRQLHAVERENELLTEINEEMVAVLDSTLTRVDEIKDKLDTDVAEPLLALRNAYTDKMQALEEKAKAPDPIQPFRDALAAADPEYAALRDKPIETALQFIRAEGEAMPAMYRAILTVLAQRGALPKGKVLLFAGYAASGPVSKAFAELGRRGWIAGTGGTIGITDKGRTALGDVPPMPRGTALRNQIRASLPGDMHRKLFDVIVVNYPRSIAKGEILKAAGYAASGPVSKAFAYLVARDYVVADGPGRLIAAKELFDHRR